MRNTFILWLQRVWLPALLATLGALAVVAVGQNQKAAKSQDEQQLREIEAKTGEFEQENDWSRMDLFLADDWISPGGIEKVLSKKAFEENVKSNFANHGNGPNPYTIEKKNMRVYLFADTAVVTYIKEYRQTLDTTKFFDQDVTDVFTRGLKGWLLHFTKTTSVATERAVN